MNKTFWRFLGSSILIALSGCLGNVVDGIIVGNLIGADGVSAVNLSRPLIQFMFTINMLVAAGASMLVGMNLGRKDFTRAAYLFTLSIGGCLAFGLLMAMCGLLMPDTVTGWLCQNEHLWHATRDYAQWVLLGAPTYMMAWALGIHVGVDGSPQLASLAVVIDNAVNLLLDVVFIQYLGLGIAGSSIATAVGHLVGIAIMMRHFCYKDNHLRLTLQRSSATAAFRQIISQGAPLAVASICLTMLLVSANSIVVATLGRTGIFAFAVCMNLLQLYNLFVAGVCRTIQSLGAIQVGKGDDDAFRFVLRKSFRFITVAMAVTCLFVWIYPEAIAMLFGADTPELLNETDHALRVFALSFIPFCYIYVLMIVYKLYDHHRMALFISFALSLTVIPVMWGISVLAPRLLWYSYIIAYLLEAIIILVLHRHYQLRFVISNPPKNAKNK